MVNVWPKRLQRAFARHAADRRVVSKEPALIEQRGLATLRRLAAAAERTARTQARDVEALGPYRLYATAAKKTVVAQVLAVRVNAINYTMTLVFALDRDGVVHRTSVVSD